MNAKIITEFIGTFFLCLTICTAAAFGVAGDFAPFAIAGTLMVMIYAGGHISGAHYNPAVTVSIWLRGTFDRSDLTPYILSQMTAGAIAALVTANVIITGTIADEFNMQMFDPNSNQTISILASEFLFTFVLVYVILNVATSESTEGNGYYGAAIASVVLAGALTVGQISLASFNPAVTLSLSIAGKMAYADMWLHLVPQLLGGCAASYAFLYTDG
ncbi:MAG: porin [Euryarchaeota archaeon]|nr:porin [Euryarchaeota archaeon]